MSVDPEPQLLLDCVEAWQRQGEVAGTDGRRLSQLAYRFCTLLAMENWQACRLVLTCVRLLAECKFEIEDIEIVFATTIALLRSPRSAFTSRMGPQEKLLVALLHVYCAHSMVFDQFVQFKVWHQWLFAPFCNAKNSGAALKKVCALTQWRFHVPAPILQETLAELTAP
jgi:hypothetical protein